MERKEGMAYLLRNGNLIVTRCAHGRNMKECARVAWHCANIIATQCSDATVTTNDLDYAIYATVNNLPDVSNLLVDYPMGD